MNAVPLLIGVKKKTWLMICFLDQEMDNHLVATVKAGTQERGTERETEVMWFHTGKYNAESHNQW